MQKATGIRLVLGMAWLAASGGVFAQTLVPSTPIAYTTTWSQPTPSAVGSQLISFPMAGTFAATFDPQPIVYRDTSLTACPQGQKLKYFYHFQDIPDLRGASWCGAAAADISWANANDPVRSRIPYVLESCQAGVAWYYSHAFPDGTRYFSPAFRDISMVCVPDTCPVPPLTPITDVAALEHENGRYSIGPDLGKV